CIADPQGRTRRRDTTVSGCAPEVRLPPSFCDIDVHNLAYVNGGVHVRRHPRHQASRPTDWNNLRNGSRPNVLIVLAKDSSKVRRQSTAVSRIAKHVHAHADASSVYRLLKRTFAGVANRIRNGNVNPCRIDLPVDYPMRPRGSRYTGGSNPPCRSLLIENPRP